ncbi:MAG: hypothetical protein OXU20_09640 [Myxococcales bacterium]|nr:hypothetical protein [Myxococcales bacterium]
MASPEPGGGRKLPAHLRRARMASRAKFVLGLAAGGFVLYRLVAVFLQ